MWCLGVLSVVLSQPVAEVSPAMSSIRTTSESEYAEQLNEDGRHYRFGTKDRGAVHVWRPQNFKPQGAVTIIYLHGFFTDVDRAVIEHQLLTQFRDSGRNALFIVPEARSGRTDPVFWTDVRVLLDLVDRRTKQRPPERLIVVGHSGGYRTIVEWLSHGAIEQVILVDGLYGNEDEFRNWVMSAEARPRQLILVGFDTLVRMDGFVKRHPESIRVDDLPYLFDELPPAVKRARVVSFQSERFDHMGMVTTGKLLPWLLHAFR
jgi:pimeloyl-ACP methyl ester carboxylesterase